MATFNGSRFIRQQLDSIINQTITPEQIVIVDDLSTDDTVSILREYKGLYPDLIDLYINTVNIGYVANFERAVSKCTSTFIALADQDDIWMPQKLEVLLNKIGDKLLIHSDAIIIDENQNLINNSLTTYTNKKSSISVTDLLLHNSVTGCTTLFRKKLSDLSLPFPESLYHDWWLSLVAASFNSLVYTDEKLIKYRIHSNNVIGCTFNQKKTLIQTARDFKYIFKRRNQKIQVMNQRIILLKSRSLCLKDSKITKLQNDISFLHDNYNSNKCKISFNCFILYARNFNVLHKADRYSFIFSMMQFCTSFICV